MFATSSSPSVAVWGVLDKIHPSLSGMGEEGEVVFKIKKNET